ncbi:hypothetical protein Gorai_003639 [Gossypium raimondii]|uniref:Uncharacterized protein n=1 Tax=Gossypium raimondii TaxID=29730 RepID=A0A7J8QPJ7_GOSRA|nr:hypothetical protein [Gossypium raimondii]
MAPPYLHFGTTYQLNAGHLGIRGAPNEREKQPYTKHFPANIQRPPIPKPSSSIRHLDKVNQQIQCISKVTVEVATTKTTLNTESANALAEEEQPHEDARPTDNQTVAQGETVEHMVYHHRCSTPMSGKAMADHMKVRKLAVE